MNVGYQNEFCWWCARVVAAAPGINVDDLAAVLDLDAAVRDGSNLDVPPLAGTVSESPAIATMAWPRTNGKTATRNAIPIFLVII